MYMTINWENRNKLFLHINQGADKKTRNYCTSISTDINIKFNTNVKVSADEAFTMGDECVDKWLIDVAKGWWLEEVFNYVCEERKVNGLVFNKNNKEFDQLLNKWYMVRIGIGVDSDWLKDAEDDGLINLYNDYKFYKDWKKSYHATNLIKWQTWDDAWKYFIFDSYFGKHKANLYEIHSSKLSAFKELVLYPTCYATI